MIGYGHGFINYDNRKYKLEDKSEVLRDISHIPWYIKRYTTWSAFTLGWFLLITYYQQRWWEYIPTVSICDVNIVWNEVLIMK